ncbi:MAG: Mrp/NBP35 family ATP-binding protein [Actinobacteria bacterium]|nr:Mrp/NBP35 family ATP-binding protein [Actinomycetota bacterium]
MRLDQTGIEEAVSAVVDPELGIAIGAAAMLRSIKVRRSRAEVVVSIPLPHWPSSEALVAGVRDVALGFESVEKVSVDLEVMDEEELRSLRDRLRDGTGDDRGGSGDHGSGDHGSAESAVLPAFMRRGSRTRIVGVSSGKGGVGKSSVTVNLAASLAAAGHSVGVLDADVYGFSIPKMLGADHDPVVLADLVIPTPVHGVRCLSMGFFVPDDEPVIWRGPMLHKAIEQFLVDAFWGEPEFLLIDMPPGTGDVTLSLAQLIQRVEMVVVTTPQLAAQRVAQRSAHAARKLKLPVRGVIENMSWFTGDDGKRYEIFGSGGGESLAENLNVPLLAKLPITAAVREGGDVGVPVVVSDPDGEAARGFGLLAERIVELGPARIYRRGLTGSGEPGSLELGFSQPAADTGSASASQPSSLTA